MSIRKMHAWNPSLKTLKSVDKLKRRGYSYRDLKKLYRIDHTTIRRHLLNYRKKRTILSRLKAFLNKF